MVPVFSSSALKVCLPTFAEAVTGWGLDVVWPHILALPQHKIAIIDATSIQHTRPPSQSEIYLDAQKLVGLNPYEEMEATIAKYGITEPNFLVYGYIPAQPQ